MLLTGADCNVKLTCVNMNKLGQCSARMKHCNSNFDPEVQIEHNQQSARFTCTDNDDCSTVSSTTRAPETTTTTITITVATSVPYCETTHITTPSPVTSHTSPTMCTPATIMTKVIASVPHCETTHTTTPLPMISCTSPTMCTPATIMTTVTTSVPYCETTHTTHNCETTSIVCNSPSTNLLATNINPLYTTSSIPIPTSANTYTSLTGQNTIKNSTDTIISQVANNQGHINSVHLTTSSSISRCACSNDISPCTGQSRSATTLHGVYMTVLLVLVAVTITMTTLVVYMCLMMRRAKSGRVPQTTTGTTHTNKMATSDYCEPISLRYMQTTGTGKGSGE